MPATKAATAEAIRQLANHALECAIEPILPYDNCRMRETVVTISAHYISKQLASPRHPRPPISVLGYAPVNTFVIGAIGRRISKSLSTAKPAVAAARCFSVWPLIMPPNEKIASSKYSNTLAST